MTTLHARKLTLISRIFYSWPKKLILFTYFTLLKGHKHLQWLLGDVIKDSAYVIQSWDKNEPQFDWKKVAADHRWYGEDSVDTQWRNDVIRPFMKLLDEDIARYQPQSILDLGSADGWRIDLLATSFREKVKFTGLDFVTKGNMYKQPNIELVNCYPLEYLEQTDQKFDYLLSTQTLFYCLPLELERYFLAFRRVGVKHLAIFDTNINGLIQKNDGKLWSKHMGYSTAWCHNYSGYFRKYGYRVSKFDVQLCKFHPSRADYHLVSVFGEFTGMSIE